MIFVSGGLLVALVSVAVALLLTLQLDVAQHLDISMMCGVLAEESFVCRAGAVDAGFSMLVGLVISLLLCVFFGRRYGRATDNFRDDWAIFWACLLGVSVLLSAHIVWMAVSDVQLSRIGAITQQSAFLSLENLIWPLLLQLMNGSKSLKFRFLYLSLLLPVVALSPFRGVLLAVLVFGFMLPALALIATSGREWVSKVDARRPVVLTAVAAALAVLLMSIYADTQRREPTASTYPVPNSALSKLEQRLSYPLFQAYFASKMSELEELPSVWDEVLIKLRLVPGPNLNEHLYGVIYGQGTVGEMTSLYVGEAEANAMTLPLIWVVIGPFSLVLLWLCLQRFGFEVSTLIGIAIWRGSLGGVATVLPALGIQILLLVALSRFGKGRQ